MQLGGSFSAYVMTKCKYRDKAHNWVVKGFLLLSCLGLCCDGKEVKEGLVKQSKTKNLALSKCLEICHKMETDCYFDCGRTINIRSIISQSLWLKCTDVCDKKYEDCKGSKVKKNRIDGGFNKSDNRKHIIGCKQANSEVQFQSNDKF